MDAFCKGQSILQKTCYITFSKSYNIHASCIRPTKAGFAKAKFISDKKDMSIT